MSDLVSDLVIDLVIDFKNMYGININEELKVKNSELYKRDYFADLRQQKQKKLDFEHFEYVRKVRTNPEMYADKY